MAPLRTLRPLRSEDCTYKVIGCAIEVHRLLGPGLLESAYSQCLAQELYIAGISFRVEESMPLEYKQVKLDCGYRLDFIVQDSLIVELKAVERILPIHQAQILTYLKLAKTPLGLLINFNAAPLKKGIKRFRI
ncbi:MAG: GxxExxY protein [Proteobacteria bacterium]|nr:MAG: GxxExxY protein [Pseudomonadota bacterium]